MINLTLARSKLCIKNNKPPRRLVNKQKWDTERDKKKPGLQIWDRKDLRRIFRPKLENGAWKIIKKEVN